MVNRWGNNGNSDGLYFLGLQNHCQRWLQPSNLKTVAPWKKSYDKPTQHIKKQKHYFADKGISSLSYGFSSSQGWMWELDHKESWVLKNCCFWTCCGIGENFWESSLNIKSVSPKEISPEYLMEGWTWSWSSNTLATWCRELTYWKRHWG